MSKKLVQPKERKRGLPPDPDGRGLHYGNADRAKWALAAVQEFQRQTGSDNDTAVGDLIADLIHMCDRYPEFGPFGAQYENGCRHYDAETRPER